MTGGHRRPRRLIATALITLVGMGVAAVYAVLPIGSEWLPRCAVRSATGYLCPGCGSQTFVQHLLHGRVGDAWEANAFLFFAAPVALLTIVAEIDRDRRPRPADALTSRTAAVIWLAVIAGWTILRNLYQ